MTDQYGRPVQEPMGHGPQLYEADHLGLGLRPGHPRRPRRRRVRTLVAVLVSLLVLVAIGAAAATGLRGLTARLFRSAADYHGSGYGRVVVQVRPGDTATEIGQTLYRRHVVASVAAFTDAAANNSKSTSVQPGFYRLHEHMQATLALDLLLSPSSIVSYRVLIPEGFTLGQLLYRVSSDTHIPFRQLLSHALHPTGLTVPAQCHHQMEGCLFPATYDVAPNATAAGVLQLMLTRFQQASTAVDLAAGARRLGYSPFQVLIVASLLEREARFTPDFGKVARVIYNRLHLGMALQLDSTVLYALHENKLLVTYQDTKVPSRYNTYLHTGLPPTPIDSPGTVALQAALHPTPGRWLYFVAVDLAGHDKFTTSYSTFLRLKAEANRNRGGG